MELKADEHYHKAVPSGRLEMLPIYILRAFLISNHGGVT